MFSRRVTATAKKKQEKFDGRIAPMSRAAPASTETEPMTALTTLGLDGAILDRSGQIAPPGRSGLFAVGLFSVGLWLTPGFAMAGDELRVMNARVPASNEMG